MVTLPSLLLGRLRDIPLQGKDNILFPLEFSITPNPSNGHITLTTGLNHGYSVSVYSMTGQRILKKDVFYEGILNLGTLPKGIYYLTADHGRDRVSKRIVIQ